MSKRSLLIGFLTLLVLVQQPLYSDTLIPPGEWQWIDSLFYTKGDFTVVRGVRENPKLFVAISVKTIPYRFQEIATVIQAYDHYQEFFKYIPVFKPIDNQKYYSRHYAAYFESGNALVYFWTIAKIDSLQLWRDSILSIYCSQIYEPTAVANAKAIRHNGWIVMEAQNFGLQWRVRSLDAEHTRVGFISYLTPTIKIPDWLFRYGYKWIVPQMLLDLQKAVEKIQ